MVGNSNGQLVALIEIKLSRDTVNSVGLIPRRLPFTTSNTIVKTFRHAIALDERRAKFKANLWNQPNAKEAKLGVKGQKPDVSEAGNGANGESTPAVAKDKKPKKPKKTGTLKSMERQFSESSAKPTNILEVRLFSFSPEVKHITYLTFRCGSLDAIVVRL